ncbi:MAG: hypothetical protein MUC53_00185 [Candidatus Contendobacter sp.]|jgi:hypothetical protein|nr:hypothetical protein [Candidatus Contendobacter sp.]
MAFTITREDGRSNSQVLLDLVNGKSPGTVFPYAELIDVLSAHTDRRYSRTEVQRIVVMTCPRMLKEQARTLICIRHVGYRIAPAADHAMIAGTRKSRADKQLLRGVETLQNVRWDEMDSNQRLAHEGQLLIFSALHEQMKSHDRRISAIEHAILKSQG